MNATENPRIIMIEGSAFLAADITAILKEGGNDNRIEVCTNNTSQSFYFEDEDERDAAHAKAIRAWQIGLGECMVIDEKVTRSFGT